jgi:predicted RNA-binding protein
LEVREYLVLKHDGTTVRYPVTGGDVAQARLRAALSQRPNDEVVVVTDDAYFRIGSAGRSHGRFRLSDADIRTGRSTAS